jgi:hypothetical protein
MDQPPQDKPARPPMKERLAAMLAEYGKVALYTYLVISLATIGGFAVLIGTGVQPSSASGFMGVLGAAWLASKATMPIRIPVALAVTPLVAAVIKRLRRRKP